MQTPVVFTNDSTSTTSLVATVTLPGAAAKTGIQGPQGRCGEQGPASAGRWCWPRHPRAAGQSGNYAATPIKASDGWSDTTGGNAGSFDWDYPITMPPSLGGGAPTLSLNYDSASVDGRTTVENGQVSDLGEGWDLTGTGAAITRSLQPCSVTDPTDWSSSGDNCAGIPNAQISGGSHSGPLVLADSNPQKFPAGFGGSSPTAGPRCSCCTGRRTPTAPRTGPTGRSPIPTGRCGCTGPTSWPAAFGGTGKDAPTYSAWSEPVFGQGSALSGACNSPLTSVPSACMGAWKWNLAFKIDPHGNITRYSYARELNGYQHVSTTPSLQVPTSYTAGGFLREIDYGWRDTDLAASTGLLADSDATGPLPAATVQFAEMPRCMTTNTSCPAGPVTVSPAGVGAPSGGVAATGITYGTSGNLAAFSDSPTDQYCNTATPATACTGYSPTFWTTARLAGIATAVARAGYTAPRTPCSCRHR